MWIPREVWEALQVELVERRLDNRKDRERIDRLTESLSQKQNIPLIMPQAELPKFQPAPQLERGSGWFDNKPTPKLPSGEKAS